MLRLCGHPGAIDHLGIRHRFRLWVGRLTKGGDPRLRGVCEDLDNVGTLYIREPLCRTVCEGLLGRHGDDKGVSRDSREGNGGDLECARDVARSPSCTSPKTFQEGLWLHSSGFCGLRTALFDV